MSVAGERKAGAPAGMGDMVWIPGGTFRMGSDGHYPEEAPAHFARVDGFWMDRTPVTNAQFRRFVEATGHVSFAELAPDPKDYPGAPRHLLQPGSLVFTPPGHEANWIHTVPGRPWFTFFRLYGPEPALFERQWVLGDLEEMPG